MGTAWRSYKLWWITKVKLHLCMQLCIWGIGRISPLSLWAWVISFAKRENRNTPPPAIQYSLNTRPLGPQTLYWTALQKISDVLDEPNSKKRITKWIHRTPLGWVMDGEEERGGLFSWLPDATEGKWGALYRVLLLKKRVKDEGAERQTKCQ